MNIMLLAMSTYPRDVRRLSAYYEKQYKFSYFTQLEPGCKHFFCTLADKGEKFGKVIALCTPETLNTSPYFIEYKGSKIDISALSPYDFFVQRMIGFIKNDENAFGYENAIGLPVEGYTKFPGSYSEEELTSLFEYIEVNNSDAETAQAIQKLISKIDAAASNASPGIAVYLNAQGGSRTIIQMINTTLNMLKSRTYSLKMVNAIDFNRDNAHEGFAIRNVTDSYLMNDLAAAMNAFLQYGRGDMFKNYYSRYKNVRGMTYAPEDAIVKAVNNISDVILLCDVNNFLEGIKALNNAIDEYNRADALKDPFFELIVKDVQNSYKQLFGINFTKHIDLVVNWCMERQLIQQAVTILESKTPEFIFNYGLIYGDTYDGTKNDISELYKNRGKLAKKIEDYKFGDMKHLFVNSVCLNSTMPNNIDQPSVQFDDLAEWIRNIDKQENKVYKNFTFGVYNNDSGKVVSINIDLHSVWFTDCEKIYPDETPENRVNKVTEILWRSILAYRTLCALRNKLNHGDKISKSGETPMQILKDTKGTIEELQSVLKEIKKLSTGYENRGFFSFNKKGKIKKDSQ